VTSLNLFLPPVVAHRGASGYAPENTLAAFIKTVQLGVQWIEFDVMLDKDGVPIIFHDECLDRITNGNGLVSECSYAYLKTLDSGSWFSHRFAGEAILSLEQGLKFLSEMKMNINIELKSVLGNEARLVQQVLPIVAAYGAYPERIIFSSFSVIALRMLRLALPDCNIGLLLHEWIEGWESIAQELNCVSIHVNQEIVTQAAVQKIVSLNKKVLCYTVNDVARAKLLLSWGVAAVFSDYPDLIT
jgi:glycerophosphoryl diester phosphodiesterase